VTFRNTLHILNIVFNNKQLPMLPSQCHQLLYASNTVRF